MLGSRWGSRDIVQFYTIVWSTLSYCIFFYFIIFSLLLYLCFSLKTFLFSHRFSTLLLCWSTRVYRTSIFQCTADMQMLDLIFSIILENYATPAVLMLIIIIRSVLWDVIVCSLTCLLNHLLGFQSTLIIHICCILIITYFFEVNTKSISSNVLKMSVISRVRSTSEIADIFNT